jgi:hypothetical protein
LPFREKSNRNPSIFETYYFKENIIIRSTPKNKL